jgi:D-tyrosyl-tRNA(Tyr) deacylase
MLLHIEPRVGVLRIGIAVETEPFDFDSDFGPDHLTGAFPNRPTINHWIMLPISAQEPPLRAVVQRVSHSQVQAEGEIIATIDTGLVVLLGVVREDTPAHVNWLADKLVNLRIFEDASGRMNRSLLAVGGQMLIVSQFTLLGDCRKGRRPSFVAAAPPEVAQPLYEAFADRVAQLGVPVQTGRFQTTMAVQLTNDGPVTLVVETPANRQFPRR